MNARLGIGRVVRAVGGFFYVEPDDGSAVQIECSVRGRLKVKTITILVGDQVAFTTENGQGVITGVVSRETTLKRPYIANVNLIVLVFACKQPDPSAYLIAKFLVLAEQSGLPFILVFNKADLITMSDLHQLLAIYRDCGYRAFDASATTGRSRETLQREFRGRIAVLAGPSGVGKSALLNMVASGFKMSTGAVSPKTGRGRHTTREVQLLRIDPDSYIADTPGFTQIALEGIIPAQLSKFFPDFREFLTTCRFDGCLHQAEPDCGVKKAVDEGRITAERYQAYLSLLAEVTEHWRRRYR
jgi:ribosome biogenesis GTPase